jgi:hypothetical protein
MPMFNRLAVTDVLPILLKGLSQRAMSFLGHKRAFEIQSLRSPASNSEFEQLNSKEYSRWITEGSGSKQKKRLIHME